MTATSTTKAKDLLATYYGLLDGGHIVECLDKFWNEDGRMVIANNPPLEGRSAIEAYLLSFFDKSADVQVRDLQPVTALHEPTNVWELDGGSTIIYEANLTYTLKSGNVVRLTGAAFSSMRDGKFAEQRIYVDFAPVIG